MPAVILNMLLPLLPYLAGGLALIFIYFKIKGKGVEQERGKWEAKQIEVKEKQLEKQVEAVSKDQEIDRKVNEDVKKIKELEVSIDPSNLNPGDKFKF